MADFRDAARAGLMHVVRNVGAAATGMGTDRRDVEKGASGIYQICMLRIHSNSGLPYISSDGSRMK